MHWLVVAPRVGDDKRLRKVDRERERNEKHDQPSAEGQAAHRTGKPAGQSAERSRPGHVSAVPHGASPVHARSAKVSDSPATSNSVGGSPPDIVFKRR